jgi:putative SOS response-associated peptidase YedK
MCGRFTIAVTQDELMVRYMIEETTDMFHKRRFNVAPKTNIPVIVLDGDILRLDAYQWGLIPFWSHTEKIKYNTINARAETVDTANSYREPFKRRRCLIPADGVIEWKEISKNEKLPYRLQMKDEHVFSMAGIFDVWRRPDGTELKSCSIITMEPSEFFGSIHDRMPFILSKSDELKWLEPNEDVTYLKSLLKPFEESEMKAYRVPKEIGSVKNQGPELIKEVSV